MNSALEYLHYIDDPLCLQVTYDYLKEHINEPPDSLIARIFAVVAISSCFVIPILKALSWIFWIMLSSRKAKAKDQQVCTEIIHTSLTTTSTSNSAYSFDSCGISFIVDNSATCVICNQRDLFIVRFSTEQVSITTCEGDSAKKRYLRTMRLIFTDDSNTNHSYDIQN